MATLDSTQPIDNLEFTTGLSLPLHFLLPFQWSSCHNPSSPCIACYVFHRQCIDNICRLKPQCDRYGMPLMVEPLVMQAFDEAFVSGYRDVIWISVGMALLGALSAQVIVSKKRNVQVRG